MKTTIIALFFLVLLLSCTQNKENGEAEKALREARSAYKNGQYDIVMSRIDTLRKKYPNAISVRKQALGLYQNAELRKSQTDLAHTDKLLMTINKEFFAMQTKVKRDKQALKATASELQQLTMTSIKRDSLKTRFDILCAKIHYIHKLQKAK